MKNIFYPLIAFVSFTFVARAQFTFELMHNYAIQGELRNAPVINNNMIFQGNEGASGAELWKTDGTSTGTLLVKDINQGINSSIPEEIT